MEPTDRLFQEDEIMRKPEKPGAAGQKAAVNIMRQRAKAEERRGVSENAVRETMDEFEERRKAKEAIEADDASSGTSGGGRDGFGLDI